MKKILLITGCVLVVLVVILGAGGFLLIRHLMQRPMYRPGMVAAGENLRGPLEPPGKEADDVGWRVERDIVLRHFAHGEGRPVLVVHGGPGLPARQPWPGLERLDDRFEFHYYDQRGCGRSTKPFDRFESSNFYGNMVTLEQTLGMGAQVADIERIRRILGEEKLLLVGHSFGGLIASMYAAEFPERVEAMVLVAPADLLVMPTEGDLFAAVRERLPSEKHPEYDEFIASYIDFGNVFSRDEAELAGMSRRFAQYYMTATGVDPQAIAEALAPYEGAEANGGWMVPAVYFSLGLRHDYTDSLAGVSAPVLVVHGTADLQQAAGSQRYVDALPKAQLRAIEEADHFLFDERPDDFADAIGPFLDEHRD